jgi:hypothetical protein
MPKDQFDVDDDDDDSSNQDETVFHFEPRVFMPTYRYTHTQFFFFRIITLL